MLAIALATAADPVSRKKMEPTQMDCGKADELLVSGGIDKPM